MDTLDDLVARTGSWSAAVALVGHSHPSIISHRTLTSCLQLCQSAGAPHGVVRTALLTASLFPMWAAALELTLKDATDPTAWALYQNASEYRLAASVAARAPMPAVVRLLKGEITFEEGHDVPQHILHSLMDPTGTFAKKHPEAVSSIFNKYLHTQTPTARLKMAAMGKKSKNTVPPETAAVTNTFRRLLTGHLDAHDTAAAKDLVKLYGFSFFSYATLRRYLNAVDAPHEERCQHASSLLARGAVFRNIWSHLLVDVYGGCGGDGRGEDYDAAYAAYLRRVTGSAETPVVLLTDVAPLLLTAARVDIVDTCVERVAGKKVRGRLRPRGTVGVIPVTVCHEHPMAANWALRRQRSGAVVHFTAPSLELRLRQGMLSCSSGRAPRTMDDTIIDVARGIQNHCSNNNGATKVTLITNDVGMRVTAKSYGVNTMSPGH